jgi:hypothetical protein
MGVSFVPFLNGLGLAGARGYFRIFYDIVRAIIFLTFSPLPQRKLLSHIFYQF